MHSGVESENPPSPLDHHARRWETVIVAVVLMLAATTGLVLARLAFLSHGNEQQRLPVIDLPQPRPAAPGPPSHKQTSPSMQPQDRQLPLNRQDPALRENRREEPLKDDSSDDDKAGGSEDDTSDDTTPDDDTSPDDDSTPNGRGEPDDDRPENQDGENGRGREDNGDPDDTGPNQEQDGP